MNVDYVILPSVLLLFAVLTVALCVRRIRTLRSKPYRTPCKLSERVVLSLAMFVVVAIAVSSLFNAIAVHRFWSSHPTPGQMVMVGQSRMHIVCRGNGAPTLVLETGLGNDALIWSGIQATLAQTTRVCAYDRAGFGWSESRSGPRDADHITAELHQLLAQAGIKGPIVLMAHSIGGLYVRDYASRYPAQIAGMIFVDSSSPLQDKNPAFRSGGSGPPAWLLHVAMVAGVPRLMGMCSGGAKDAGYDFRKVNAEAVCRMHYSSMLAELSSFDRSGEETIHTGPYGDVPILVFSHDPAKVLQGRHSAQDVARQNAWSGMQENLKRLSTNGRRIIAVGSTHYVMRDRADLLEKEVPLFIKSIRGNIPPSLPNGSTSSE